MICVLGCRGGREILLSCSLRFCAVLRHLLDHEFHLPIESKIIYSGFFFNNNLPKAEITFKQKVEARDGPKDIVHG